MDMKWVLIYVCLYGSLRNYNKISDHFDYCMTITRDKTK